MQTPLAEPPTATTPDQAAALLTRLQQREPGAMEEVIATHGRRLFALIDRIVSDRWGAEDVLQDVFLRLFLQADLLQNPESLGAWLTRVARNRALTHGRDRRPPVETDRSRPDESPSPAEQAEQAEQLCVVQDAVERLNEPLRTTFRVCAFDGEDYSSAARILQSNRTTINTRMFRSWQRLRAMLDCA
jgi:RNA polymerase sigma-70 factor (ECF subfamily)